jgi:MFS family permease
MSRPPQRLPRRLMAAGILSSAFEWYDFFIYGTAAALVFGPLFFPGAGATEGVLLSFATFWAGFVARPLGGLLLASVGDRVGRKPILLVCLVMMTVATVGIGLLPSTAAIGIAAPILLVLLRFVQGVAVGAQWGGVVLLLTESAGATRKGRAGAFGQLGSTLGFVLGGAVFLLAGVLTSPEQFASWGWRIPFLASVLLLPVVLYIHFKVEDSPEFKAAQERASERPTVRPAPVREVLRTHLRSIVLAAGMLFAINATSYAVMTGILSYGTTALGLPRQQLLTAVLIATSITMVTLYLSAVGSDRWGRRPFAIAGSVLMLLWAFPFFWLLDTGNIVLVAVAAFVGYAAAGVCYGPAAAYIAELFPTHVRYSGATLVYQSASILVSGGTPFIMTALFASTGTSMSMAGYLAVMAAISTACCLALPETYHPASAPAPTDTSVAAR